MPVPKRKHSRSRRDMALANKGMKVKSFSGCTNCAAPIIPHSACASCGFYKGAKVMATKSDRMLKRGKALEVKESKQKTEHGHDESEDHSGHSHS